MIKQLFSLDDQLFPTGAFSSSVWSSFLSHYQPILTGCQLRLHQMACMELRLSEQALMLLAYQLLALSK